MPHPVTGSQPSVAGNPSVPQPIALPLVISVKALKPPAYNQGLRNPSGGLPLAIRKSLTREMTALAVGVDALVPSSQSSVPFHVVMKWKPCAAMSGYARPWGLKSPEKEPLREDTYFGTTAFW